MPVGANLDAGSPSAGPASEDVANRRDVFLAQDSNTTPPFASQPVAGRVVTELESTLIATSLSESTEVDSQNVDREGSIRRYITDLRIECPTGLNYPALYTFRIIILELGKEGILLLERDSPELWKRTSFIELPADVDNLTIVVTSDEPIAFAHMTFTKDELASEGREKSGCVKVLISGADAPVLKFSFVIIEMSDAEWISAGEDDNDDESPYLDLELAVLGTELMDRFERTENLPDISAAIAVTRRAIELTSDEADIPGRLNNLGILYQHRFECTGDFTDLSEAVSTKRQAVQLTPDGDSSMAAILSSLGSSLLCSFESTGNLAEIEETISVLRRSVQLTRANDAHMHIRLSNLGISFSHRFNCTGDLPDISEAISHHQHAVELTPKGHVDMSASLNNLGVSYQARFEHTGDLLDIDKAISVQQEGLHLAPNGHAQMLVNLNNLGVSYQSRFEHTGNLNDIEVAISSQERAVQLTPEDDTGMPTRLNSLGVSYQCRFKRTGNPSDITQSLSALQKAVQLTPEGHADMPARLNNLGNSFQYCFDSRGDLNDISESISLKQQAVLLTPRGHISMPARLNNLGNSFMRRFEHTSSLQDISEAISVQQRAVQLTPDHHVELPVWLSNLGNSFQCRFDRTFDLPDISEAINVHRRAVQITPGDHTNLPGFLNNLGNSFQSRFERTGDLADSLEAIAAHKRAVQLTPNGHASLPGRLNNLGSSHRIRFERTGNLSDIEESISSLNRAVQLTPSGHPNMPGRQLNIGNAYQARFERTGDFKDISEAISAKQQVVQLTPNGHAEIPSVLNNLGGSFLSRFEHTNDVADIHSAASIYKKSAISSGPPSTRLLAAQMWAKISEIYNPSESLEAYGFAIDLVSQVAGMHRTIEQRHSNLIEISSLATSAASAAFAHGEVEKALEWLEQGRCLVWSQLNQLRAPVDDLRAHDEDLARRFLQISSALESSGSRRESNIDAPISEKITLEDEARAHVELAQTWSELLDEIRRIPTFHDFLRPPQAPDLLRSLPLDGPIVLINIHESRCDALALLSGSNGPIHIALPKFTHKQASGLRERLRNFLSFHGVRMRDADRGGRPARHRDAEKRSDIHVVLEATWLHVVRPILNGLGYSSHPPLHPARIWWCPTGPLAFLPLHAAGIYNQDERSPPASCISDFAVSSYTPTVSALLEKVKASVDSDVRPSSSSKLLIISQPNTPGRSRIPGTTKEMNAIMKTIKPEICESLNLEGEVATVSRVKLEMESHSSIHFACHASQNIENPLKSGFYLHDGRLELAEIMRRKIDHCTFAFLSACQTSTGDERLSEEAVHLAAGMLAVGYRGVVATMWSIKDQYGPVVAEGFYRYLIEKGGTAGLDTAGAAHGLHHTIQGIRNTLGNTEEGLLTWVPYVHFGY